MTKEGRELGVQLGNLWFLGRSIFPRAAEVHIEANHIVAGTNGDAHRFMRYGGGTGHVYPHWDRLRDEFQKILAESANNLYDTGEALVRVAELFAETDAAAAAELNRVQRDYESRGEFPIRAPEDRKTPALPE